MKFEYNLELLNLNDLQNKETSVVVASVLG